MAGSTNAKGLEEMTISMLLGGEGKQKEELDRLVQWMATHCEPEIIHLSNALLLGLAHRLKEKLKVPVVCSLQDEHVWVDVMKTGARDKVWKLMQDKVSYVDGFVAVSDYYASVMKEKMKIPSEKLIDIHLGVDVSDYQTVDINMKKRNIGFLSRMSFENGVDILVDAFISLKKLNGFDDVKLILTGGKTGDDSKLLRNISRKLRKENLYHDVEFYDDFEDEGRKAFFDNISVLSVPVREGEAFGLYLVEAMASGIPVVQPALGAFPEIIEISGGGFTYEPNTPEKLAEALARILENKELLVTKSRDGYQGVLNHFNIRNQANKLMEFYERVINSSV